LAVAQEGVEWGGPGQTHRHQAHLHVHLEEGATTAVVMLILVRTLPANTVRREEHFARR
jgi:hypothetical protein